MLTKTAILPLAGRGFNSEGYGSSVPVTVTSRSKSSSQSLVGRIEHHRTVLAAIVPTTSPMEYFRPAVAMQHPLIGNAGFRRGHSPAKLPWTNRRGLTPEANLCGARLGFGRCQHRIVGVLGVVPRQSFRHQRDTEINAVGWLDPVIVLGCRPRLSDSRTPDGLGGASRRLC